MRRSLRPDAGLPAGLLWLFAIVAGISVANIYYIQPLLGLMRDDLGLTDLTADLVALATQVGYALGLFLAIPLGDLFQRKHIIVTLMSVLCASLVVIAASPWPWLTVLASLVTGACSVTPQIFIPIASQFSEPLNKSRNVGRVLSGLLVGVLGGRVLSGLVGEAWGWRSMYVIAALLMAVCAVVVLAALPAMPANYEGTWAGLMGSLLRLPRAHPRLMAYSARSGLCFGSMLAMWSTLAFKLEGTPFHASSDVVGLLGLCGVCGALTASFAGRWVDRFGVRAFNVVGAGCQLAAWACLWFGQNTYAGIIAGIILLDIGMQCVQLSNQSTAFALDPSASSRINTIFMTTYFVGGAVGTLLAGAAWDAWAWAGVLGTGALMAAASLAITATGRPDRVPAAA
ncbi:MAG: MFS transporter [Bifidobacteriaceae bacterium]|jgi:predicted MFS family arabinose efflux permease|nr:MFS transporter [Bifidobacteriaceae bacterium]